MSDSHLFIDGSVHTQSKVGIGACLLLSTLEVSPEHVEQRILTHLFENTSSTVLELENLLWVLEKCHCEIESSDKIWVYTDSQNLVGLPARRQRLEQNKFMTKRGSRLNGADDYQQLFALIDKFEIRFCKVRGHSPQQAKSHTDKLFSLVDRAARRTLREHLN